MSDKVKGTMPFAPIFIVALWLLVYTLFSCLRNDTADVTANSSGSGRRPLTRSVEVVDTVVEEVAPLSIESSSGKNVNITINVN